MKEMKLQQPIEKSEIQEISPSARMTEIEGSEAFQVGIHFTQISFCDSPFSVCFGKFKTLKILRQCPLLPPYYSVIPSSTSSFLLQNVLKSSQFH
jgi:hypothetical protein